MAGETQAHRDVIVVGASLGGIAALATLAGALPAALPAAVLVVLHTSPQSPRLLAGIIDRRSSLPVAYAEAGEDVKPGRIYVAPPDFHMTVEEPGVIGLHGGPKVNFARPAVDSLFFSAAKVYGRRVIGVVLTGGGEDGAIGLSAITDAEGVGIVQDPAEAEDPGMPTSALHYDHPQYLARIEEMPDLLANLVSGSIGRE